MSTLKLYVDSQWVSPYALSAFVALEEKAIDYTVQEVSLVDGEHLKPSYPSPTGRVPCVQHDELVLAESSAIVEYVDETFSGTRHPAILPIDRRERAMAREVMAWVRSDLMPIREERPTTAVFSSAKVEPLSDTAKAAAERLFKGASLVLAKYKTTIGAAWSVADVDLALMLQRLILNGDSVPAPLREYAAFHWKRPSVQRWVTHTRPETLKSVYSTPKVKV